MKIQDKANVTSNEEIEFDFFDFSDVSPFDVKKAAVSSDLCTLLAKSNITRDELANKLQWSVGRLNNVLAGHQNLSLKTISEITFALGFDFQFAFKKPYQPKKQASCKQESHSIEMFETCVKNDFVEVEIPITSQFTSTSAVTYWDSSCDSITAVSFLSVPLKHTYENLKLQS